MQFELVSGRFFTDSEQDKAGIILNESAAKMLGITEANKEMLDMGHIIDGKPMPMPVVGILKNFYYSGNTGQPIGALALTNYADSYRNIYIQNTDTWSGEQISRVTQVLQQFDDTYTYSGRELSRVYGQKYRSIERTRSLVWAGALLAILLSLSGLVALSVMNVGRRTKEVGMRKVLGSTELEVVFKLMKDTLQWIPVSAVVAFVGMYYYLNNWLADFANKIPLSAWFYIVSAVVVLVFAVLAVSWQTWRAASRNPIKALRYE
jgi:putative ABC transport system permease protein